MNIFIAEDEEAAMRRMERLLKEAVPDGTVVGRAATIIEACDWFVDNEWPDLALLDIQLADGESFEIFKRVEVRCPVIFTTAHDEHALRAFQVNALDYLLKPVKLEELEAAVARVRRMGTVRDASRLSIQASEPATAPVRRFLIRYGDTIKVVEPKDIAYIHSMEKNTFLRTREGRDLPMDESLDRLERQLDPSRFFRINRQVIAQFDSIRELVAYSKSRVKVVLDPPYTEDAIVSSERSASFKRWLSGE